MNCHGETAKMGVPPGNRAQRRRLRRVQGVGSEAYLSGTSQGATPEDAWKDAQIIRARCAPLSPASGFPVSRSEQVIHEISGLIFQMAFITELPLGFAEFRRNIPAVVTVHNIIPTYAAIAKLGVRVRHE
jgi:hypothetical protein